MTTLCVMDPGFQAYKHIVQQRPKSHASFIHDSIVAAVDGYRGRYWNPRLSERESDGGHMPLLTDDSVCFWCVDALHLVVESPFYQRLRSFMPFTSTISAVSRTPTASVSVPSADCVDEPTWTRFWNTAVHDALRLHAPPAATH